MTSFMALSAARALTRKAGSSRATSARVVDGGGLVEVRQCLGSVETDLGIGCRHALIEDFDGLLVADGFESDRGVGGGEGVGHLMLEQQAGDLAARGAIR